MYVIPINRLHNEVQICTSVSINFDFAFHNTFHFCFLEGLLGFGPQCPQLTCLHQLPHCHVAAGIKGRSDRREEEGKWEEEVEREVVVVLPC